MKHWLRHASLAAVFTLLTLAAPLALEMAAPSSVPDLILRDAPPVLSVKQMPPKPPPQPGPPKDTEAEAAPGDLHPAPPTAIVQAQLDVPGQPTVLFSPPSLVVANFNVTVEPGLATSPLVFETVGVDEPPRVLVQVEPVYPANASLRNQEGSVVVEFEINTDGRVVDERIVTAEPSGWFENAALTAVRQWRFTPAKSGGLAVGMRVRQKLAFQLDNH